MSVKKYLNKDEVNDLKRGIKKAKADKIVNFPVKYNRTDVGNAKRFVDVYGKLFRYCHNMKTWFYFDGRRWVADNCGLAQKSVHVLAQTMQAEAGSIPDPDERVQAFKWAVGLESANRIENCLKAAQPYLPVDPADFDRDHWLLNCLNGTVDLRTGELRPHSREDMISKLCPVEYDPGAEAPTWHEFLNSIMGGNRELITFLQKAVGYSLTGDTREQCMFILHGNGGNGKTTFLSTIAAMLGDGYALQMPMNTLMIRHNENVPNDLARLKGARFVSSVEVEEGQRLAESLVKQMTGGDKLVARFLRAEFFEFKPEFKLWLATNHKPQIRGTDHAMWRRIRLIPFEVKIPKEKQDKNLPQKLLAELPGVLIWAIQGLKLWLAEGLEPPGEVEKATDAYRAEMDVLSQFFEEKCLIKGFCKASASDLYAAYCKWCDENGERAIKQRDFSARLIERGFLKSKSTGGRFFWAGIGLVESGNKVDKWSGVDRNSG
ncbi:MAG: hypothetical protein K6T66_13120 [Peptococcaceae bacterium]|nr:hypothetical protein [Peptococcaceae bacterium]